MNHPKVNFGVTKEEQKQSKKLNFTETSRAEALRKIEQDLRKNEKSVPKVSPIQRDKNVQQPKQIREHTQQESRTTPKNSLDQFPIFPGHDPIVYQLEENIHRDSTIPAIHIQDEKIPSEEKQEDSAPQQREERLEMKPFTIKTPTFTMEYDDTFEDRGNRNKFKQGFMFTLSILGAIALGSLFGYLLLLMVLASDGISTLEEVRQTQMVENDKSSSPVSIDLIQGGTAAVGKLTISDRTFYAIQAGAFMEEERGKQAYERLKEQDVPVILFEDDVYRIFLGIGYHEDDVVDLHSMFRWLDTELYLKKYTIHGGTVAVAGATRNQMELLDTFFVHGTFLLEKTAAWTANALNGKFSVSAEDWRKFKATHETFLQEAKQLTTFLSEEQMEMITTMKDSIDQAVLAMARYIETSEMKEMVLSQQGLLQYFDAYRMFINTSKTS